MRNIQKSGNRSQYSNRSDKKIYYYYRYHAYGFDKITIIAFNKEQADATLKDSVKHPEDWYYKNVINLNVTFQGESI